MLLLVNVGLTQLLHPCRSCVNVPLGPSVKLLGSSILQREGIIAYACTSY